MASENIADDADPKEDSDHRVDDDQSPLQILEEAERIALDQQAISVAERESDANLFGGRDRERDRFVRLKLRNSYHHFTVPGADSIQEIVLEPRLLIHQSGVLQLDLAIRAEASMSISQILAILDPAEPVFHHSRMSLPIIRRTPWMGFVAEYDSELDAGEPLAVFDHDSPASMRDLLDVYLEAVMGAARIRSSDWIIYPVAFIRPGSCCPEGRWRQYHTDETHRIAIRAYGDWSIADHVNPPKDLSLIAEKSLFAELGSVVYFQWYGAEPYGIDELPTVLMTEYALLIFMRLQTLESRVARMDLGERVLRRRFVEAIDVFSELRQGNARAGETRQVIRHILNQLGAEQIRPTVESALELASMAHSTVSAQRAARRSWWVTVLATVVALFVATPAIRDVLDSVRDQPAEGSLKPLLTFLHLIADLGFWGPWTLMGSLIFGVGTLMIAGWAIRHRPRQLPSFRRGYAWPTEITAIRQRRPGSDPASNDAR